VDPPRSMMKDETTESQPKENNRPDVEIGSNTEVSSKLLITQMNNLVVSLEKEAPTSGIFCVYPVHMLMCI